VLRLGLAHCTTIDEIERLLEAMDKIATQARRPARAVV
jgi:hypothetical protein